ncbi:MAG TPA: glycosyltransferase family 4 protein [Acidimicrobiales bacterium]|nr:glycosyltransferase family 4 protein [Acidimicrobiales bacterium]
MVRPLAPADAGAARGARPLPDHPTPATDAPGDGPEKIGDLAAGAGIRRIHVLAWRDLDDVEAGGSELHAHEVCREWAAAGLEVTCRTSFAQGHPPDVVRDGYRVRRKAGRYLVFPRSVAAELAGRHGPRDALVEIWNGMPFLSPLWARGPRITFLHHVHAEMWKMVLPPRLARMGDLLERRIAPPLYRHSRIVTLSESSRADMARLLHPPPDRVDVVPPGISPRFRPGVESATPLVVAVGRLVPSKHVDQLVHAAARARLRVPGLRLVVVGEGYERLQVEAAVDAVDGRGWVELPGRVGDDELVALYQQAWVLASASSHEGWGMSITEAAACATPAVVTDIAGHRDAVVDGVTGRLVRASDHTVPERLGDALADVLADDAARRRMSQAAADHAARFTWRATATQLMAILADEAARRNP